ncbi:MAG TPA: hypothetical protein ENI19_02165 [Candidatus Nealsonbacteria bacterium]|uniref:Glycosyltransferase RgtA/B/C/D-like domain-containing protein n=1 Tax=marine sediment metagenome TaxID=412755 RepID=A0A0F9YED4_9ZZZZ|nr:hypothetical protein [Candidatus Nealsonbacteria bacterium]HEB46493.1 hypothetical protein [Candidatus Nealsonbacteria bacterium]
MKNKGLLFLLLILVIASFFRLWQLDSIPPGLYPDEAINGNNALEVLRTGNLKVFYPDNNGREGLFINLVALSFAVFGASVWSLKIVTAIIGILTVLGLYLLTKELFSHLAIKPFNHSAIALLASFFLAISFWHTNFSRIGFRGILVPFVLVFGLYFLMKAFRTKKLSNFIFSGIFWGIGFYTYISFRMAVIIIIIILILKFIEYLKKERSEIGWGRILWKKIYLRDGWWKVNVFLVVIILIALPIGIYFLQNPGDFIGRATGVSIFSQQSPVMAFGESLVKHLGMFNFYGDPNWRHNFAGSPMLFWPIGILFLIGIVLSIRHLIQSIKTKNYPLFTVYCLLFIWFFAMLLPGVLTYEGVPHALRVIGVIPVVYIFAAIGGLVIYGWLKNIIKKPKLLFVLCLLFIVFTGYSEFNKYFYNWAKNSEVEKAFSKNYVTIGNYLNSLPSKIKKYVIVNEPGVPLYGISIPAQTVIFIEAAKFNQPRSIYVKAEDLNKIETDQKETIIVPLYDGKLFDELRKKFPQGKVIETNSFYLYRIE